MANTEVNLNVDSMEEDEIRAADSFSRSSLQLSDGDKERHVDSPMINRARPGSIIGRQSVQSTSSRTSMRPNVIQTQVMSQRYYSYRFFNNSGFSKREAFYPSSGMRTGVVTEWSLVSSPTGDMPEGIEVLKQGVFDNAVQACKDFLKPDLDGELKGAWLLTLVDHWDLNHERVLLLTDYSLFLVKYDFVCMKLVDQRRIQLHIIDRISLGDLKYPNKSMMYDRQHGGVRIAWKGEEPTFGQLWNPFCETIPWIVVAHHPLLYDQKENETVTYNVDDFYDSLVLQVSKACEQKGLTHRPMVVEEEIVIDSYVNLSSVVFNQSSLGYFKHRGEFKY